jgi:hypothetical protein
MKEGHYGGKKIKKTKQLSSKLHRNLKIEKHESY